MSTWSKRGRSSVPYVWTAKDHEYEQGGKPDGITEPRVTTYRIKPGALPGADKAQPGQEIAVKLDDVPRLGEPWTINRFYPADAFDWEELTGDALTSTASCQTIGELCQKLFALDPRKYPDHYYNLEKAAPRAKHDAAAMLFEYWDNTHFRYEVTKDGFDWSILGDKTLGAPGIPAVKGDLRLRWVLMKKPTPIVRAVAPGDGAQSILAPPAVFEPLAHHAREIEQATARARALLDQSAVYVTERTRLAHQTTALRVLLQTAASAPAFNPAPAVALATKARGVEQAITEKARTATLPELLGAQQGAPSAALAAVMRRELGYVQDIHAALSSCRDGLCGKLLDDGTSFARHVEDWLTWVMDKKQQQAQPVQAIYTRLAHAVAGAFGIFEELDVSDAYASKITALLDAVPAGAFTDPRQAGASAMHKLGAVLGRERAASVWPWLGNAGLTALGVIARGVIPAASSTVGNLAGPPSLTVAWIQLTKWREFQRLIQTIHTDVDYEAKMQTFVDETIAYLDAKGSKMPKEVKKKLRAAMNSHDPAELAKIKRDVLDEFSGTFQASNHQKVGALVLQLLSLAVAWADYYGKKKKGDATMLDFVADILQSGQATVGAVDVYLSVRDLGATEGSFGFKVARYLPKIGMVLGLASALVGLISSVKSGTDARQQGDKLGMAVASATGVGNLFLFIACSAWLASTPLPGVNVAGLVLVIGGSFVGIVVEEHEKGKTRASKITASLVHQIRTNPFYESFAADKDLRAALTELAAAGDAGDVQKPPNNDFVRRALADAGFDLATIDEVVDHATAPLFPGLMPQPG